MRRRYYDLVDETGRFGYLARFWGPFIDEVLGRTAVGSNCKSITLQNSTIQGVP